uniref:Uncharacterized protein n=1 Tax=Chromera velia CCMP2878 TaxID=1169474 RepID=A0A0G4F0M9_9ALVE|eukprot:Cvel_2573.t1-p1 / transcript=Cvel_2573.t1 / gene=Cvel_2573 / organism=Chromera_velia_CCMP2878 / gene_product=hypothetical protein / transcript_product=hypothetical protein / location=Cvel_scaffold102:9847-12458(-) / protein_length=334 / sequence_SO=supercontig / SO=protein_coding / is_pseudo=false
MPPRQNRSVGKMKVLQKAKAARAVQKDPLKRLPMEQKARSLFRKSASKVEIVILLQCGGGTRLTMPGEWSKLREESKEKVAVVPCVDSTSAHLLDGPFRAWMEPLAACLAWGDQRTPRLLAGMIKSALGRFPSARWIFWLPNNSMPLKSWGEFEAWTVRREGLKFPSAIDWGDELFDNNKIGHQTWLGLIRKDAQSLADHFCDQGGWSEFVAQQKSLLKRASGQEGPKCPMKAYVAEEWMPGTFLARQYLKKSAKARITSPDFNKLRKDQGVTMDEDGFMHCYMESVSKCGYCGEDHGVFRAKQYTQGSREYRIVVRELKKAKENLFLRKVIKY